MPYLFEASILKSYFDLYNIAYEQKNIIEKEGEYYIVDFLFLILYHTLTESRYIMAPLIKIYIKKQIACPLHGFGKK